LLGEGQAAEPTSGANNCGAARKFSALWHFHNPVIDGRKMRTGMTFSELVKRRTRRGGTMKARNRETLFYFLAAMLAAMAILGILWR